MTTATIDVDALYREHRRQVFWAAWRRLEDWHDAEDAVQNTFLKVWERRDSHVPRDDKPAVAWVTGVAKWEALTLLRQRRRYVAAGEWAERFAEELPDTDTSSGLPCTADPETCAAVYAALAALTDQQRLAVQMQCLQGMERTDVARCLRLSLYEVAELTRQALRRLERHEFPQKREQRRPATSAETAPVTGPPAGVVDEQTAAAFQALPDLLAALPPRQRDAVRLRYFEGLSLSQIAGRLGCAQQSVVAALRQAKERLRNPEPLQSRTRCSGPPVSPHVLRVLETPDLLAAIPPRQRQAIVLRFREGLSVEDAATRMGATPRAVVAMVQKVMRRERTRMLAGGAR